MSPGTHSVHIAEDVYRVISRCVYTAVNLTSSPYHLVQHLVVTIKLSNALTVNEYQNMISVQSNRITD